MAEPLDTGGPPCEICGVPALRRVSGGKFWCGGCGHLQS